MTSIRDEAEAGVASDTIIFAKFPGEIYRVPGFRRSNPSRLLDWTRRGMTLVTAGHTSCPMETTFSTWPGRWDLASDENVIKVGSLDGKTDRILFQASSPVEYDSGYLLFVVNKNLMARPFDTENSTSRAIQ